MKIICFWCHHDLRLCPRERTGNTISFALRPWLGSQPFLPLIRTPTLTRQKKIGTTLIEDTLDTTLGDRRVGPNDTFEVKG